MTTVRLLLRSLTLVAACATLAAGVHASEIGHFAPGVPNMRDFTIPGGGFFAAVYNYGYMTRRINDGDGNRIDSITVHGPGRDHVLSLDADLNVYVLAPAIIWGAPKKVLGARYGAYITQPLSNTSINGTLWNLTIGAGHAVESGAQFNIGDTFVQPVWLDWSGEHYDISYGYSFYIPSGKYHTTATTIPGAGTIVKAEAPDNIGLGFWTNQNQGAVYLYPWGDKRMAVENTLTWEMHRKKRGFDLTPGQNLSWNWGVSQFLPIRKDGSMLMEVGPAGYSSWQITDDTGSEARNPSVHDRVHAVGVQVGVISVKRMMGLSFHYFNEFSSADRFQGHVFGLNFSLKF